MRSRSLPRGGASNCNEIRFDDEKGAEQINVQAGSALDTLVKGSETRQVGGERTTITKSDMETITEGDYVLDVHQGSYTCGACREHRTTVKHGDQFVTVEEGRRWVSVKSDQVTAVEGRRKSTITGDDEVEITDGDLKMRAKAGHVRIDAAKSIVLKVGETKIEITSNGVRIDGPTIRAQAEGEVQVVGGTVKVQGDGVLNLKSSVTEVDGQGMLKMRGGSVLVN